MLPTLSHVAHTATCYPHCHSGMSTRMFLCMGSLRVLGDRQPTTNVPIITIIIIIIVCLCPSSSIPLPIAPGLRSLCAPYLLIGWGPSQEGWWKWAGGATPMQHAMPMQHIPHATLILILCSLCSTHAGSVYAVSVAERCLEACSCAGPSLAALRHAHVRAHPSMP